MAHDTTTTIANRGRGARRVLAIVACIAIVAGVAARFVAPDHTLFWQDEAFSMLRITGHDQAELDRRFDGRVHPASDLFALDRLDARRGVAATLASLREEPQRGPLFYVAARVWAGAAGDGVAAMRALSACIGVACIAFAFLLGRRLTRAWTGGAVLAALVAIAPIEVRFSDQVREYEAVAAAVFASGWLLFRAIERPVAIRFAAYAACVLAGLYASPIFAAAIAAHAVAVAVAARRDGRAVAIGWCASIAVAAAAFAPWLAASLRVAGAHANDLAWLSGAYSLRSYALKWAFNVGAVFFDAEFARVRLGLVLVPILAFVAAAFASAVAWPRDAAVRAYALATALCTLVPLVALDALRHAHFETVTRYQMTTWAGVDILAALLIARGIAAGGNAARGALAAFAFLATCGIFSAAFARPYAVWWDDNEHLDERAVADTIAASSGPAVVVATKNGSAEPYALVLSRYLAPDTAMLLYGGALPALPAGFRSTYLFAPDAGVVREVARRVGPARAVRDVSPALGLTIPDLRAPRDAQAAAALRADNALWRIDSGSTAGQR